MTSNGLLSISSSSTGCVNRCCFVSCVCEGGGVTGGMLECQQCV
jgi:hypothetical protein